MKFLRHNKNQLNQNNFSKSDYFVLSYEQLLNVNGAGSSTNKSSTPSSNTTTSTTSSGPTSGYGTCAGGGAVTPSSVGGAGSGYGTCAGGGASTSGSCTIDIAPTSGSWGQMTDENATNQTMQDYKKDTKKDNSMNGAGNSFSTVGCKMEGTAKLLSQISGSKVDILDVNNNYDKNKDGLMTQEEITAAIKNKLKDGQTVTPDYYELKLCKETLDTISNQEGTTYVLGRAEDVHGGQHWIVLEGYSINSNGQVEFDYNGTSSNDKGRKYILGNPTGEQKNDNYFRISKIETYTIK